MSSGLLHWGTYTWGWWAARVAMAYRVATASRVEMAAREEISVHGGLRQVPGDEID